MNYKTVKILDGGRIVEVSCDKTGDLMAVIGLDNSGSVELHEINTLGRVDRLRVARHFGKVF